LSYFPYVFGDLGIRVRVTARHVTLRAPMVFTFQTQGFMSYHRLEQERKREMKIAVQKHRMSASSFLMSNPLRKDAANQPGAETKITKRTHIQRAAREIMTLICQRKLSTQI